MKTEKEWLRHLKETGSKFNVIKTNVEKTADIMHPEKVIDSEIHIPAGGMNLFKSGAVLYFHLGKLKDIKIVD